MDDENMQINLSPRNCEYAVLVLQKWHLLYNS